MADDYWAQFEEVTPQNNNNNDYWAQFEVVEQPQPQPKNVVPNRPANQELKVQEQAQELNPDAKPSTTQLQGGVEKKYIQQDGYIVDTETGEKTPIGGMEIRKPDDKISLKNFKDFWKLGTNKKLQEQYKRQQAGEMVKNASRFEKDHPVIAGTLKDYMPWYRSFEFKNEWDRTHDKGVLNDLKKQLGMYGLNFIPSANLVAAGTTMNSSPVIATTVPAVTQGVTSAIGDMARGTADANELWKRPLTYGGLSLGFGLAGNVIGKGLNGVRRAEVMKNWNTPLAKRLEAKGKTLPIKEEVQPVLEQPQQNNIVNQPQQTITQQPKLTPSQEANNIINTQKENLVKELGVDNINEMAKPEYSKEMRDEAINIIAAATGKKPEYIQMVAKSSTGNKGVATKNSKLQELMEGGSENIVDSGLGNDLKFYGKKGLTYDDAEIEGGYNTIQQAWDDLVNDNFYINKELSQYDNMLNSADNKIKETFKNLIDDPENFANNVTKYSDEVTEYLEKNVPEQDRGQFYDAFYNGLDKINQYADNVNGLKAGTKKVRSFGSSKYGKEIQEAVTDKTYDVNSRELEKSGWEALTPEQQQALINDTNAMSPVAIYGKAQAVEKAIANGEKPSQVMLNSVAKKSVEAGQTIESLKNFLPTTPKGIAMAITKQARDEAAPSAIKIIDNAESIVNELRNIRIPDKKKAIEQILKKHGVVPRLKNKPASLINDLSKLKDLEALDAETLIELVQNKYKIPTVTVDDYVKMDELANKFATATTDREKQVATGLIKKFVNDKGIKDFSKMEKSFRMINMLYTGAGRIADAGFTGLNQGIRAIDDKIARGISALTNSGTRGKSTPISQWMKDVYTGGKNAAEDIDMNISTPRGWETDRYDLGFTPQFEGVPILGGAEKGLRYGIEVPDRAWSNGTYEAVKRDLKSAGGFTDEEIEKIASDEALRSVYQKDAGATKLSGDILKHLNDFGKEYGVNIGIGNRISPFYRTTTNLYSDALARTTGYDFLVGALKRAKATTKAEVREAENQMARGITGLGLTGGLGYVGANTINNIGQLNPIDTYGDDVTGMAPQSIVIGDKSYSLSRNPLLTIAMGIGKELYSKDPAIKKLMKMAANTGAVAQDFPAAKNLGSIVKGLGTVQEQLEESNDEKFLQALNRGLTPAIANIVNQDVPFNALLGATRVGADPFNHEIYSDNPVEYFWNLTKNRYPGLSSTLPIKYNAMGEPSLRSNINNGQARFYDALLNPTPVRNYNSKGATVRDDLDKFAQVAQENKYAGRTNVPLKKLARSIEVNGEKKVLNNKEYSEAQRLYGKLQTKYKKDIFNQKGWSDEKKVEELSKVRHDAEEAVKIKLFNHKKRNGKYTNRMIDDIKNGDL